MKYIYPSQRHNKILPWCKSMEKKIYAINFFQAVLDSNASMVY